MSNRKFDRQVALFSTCPPSNKSDSRAYLEQVEDVARWSESAGCTGILVYSDNSLVDPWLVAEVIIRSTRYLCPLVAVQPVYMHPYTLAKMIATIGFLYGRRIYLNMVAGGFKNDLLALNDTTPHDLRYERLIEYTTIIKRLLQDSEPVSFEGEFYKVDKLRLSPSLPHELFPGIFISGSSDAGLAAAKTIEATAIQYPKPVNEYTNESMPDDLDTGMRIGIVCRGQSDDAWSIAHERFPEDRKGQLTHKLAMKVSDSAWHKQLSDLADSNDKDIYWLVPFQNYKTMCPYLVGDYQQVGDELSKYVSLGYQSFILDVPPNEEELAHTRKAFERIKKVS